MNEKSIMISLSPYWYYLIGEGIKKIEIRKTFPKSEEWNYIIACYMTKDKKSFDRIPKEFQEKYSAHMGKVGMQIKCDNVFPIRVFENGTIQDYMFHNLDRSCVPYDEIASYIGYDKTGYGLDINVELIYEDPKELRDFFKTCNKPEGTVCSVCIDRRENNCEAITRPPQSWCYIYNTIRYIQVD